MKKDTKVSLPYQQILHKQVIDENSPGTVLRDFETLLEFIGHEDVNVSGKYNLLPMKLLPQPNEQLTCPIEIWLTRPGQKSYPHINGLYLLLRATGITCIKGAGTKQLLVLDNAILQSWRGLNPTERYFTLLKLERIDPVDPEISRPMILETHGKAPKQYPVWDE